MSVRPSVGPTARPILRLSAALILAVSALGACAAFQDKTFGQSIDETSAATQIRTRLLASGGPNHFGEVDVEVEDRFVLLSGRVPSEEDRQTAERIAWSVNIIDEVADELVIEQRNVKRDVSDLWIGQQVRARLLAARKVNSINYNVQVYDGTVYLLGQARSDDEVKAAAEQASVVRGVGKVVSYVKVRGPAPRPGEAQASAPAPRQTPPPQARASQSSGPVQIAPPAETAAPIVPPDRPPTTRSGYSDPYANGATPPPGRNSSNELTSQPLPPVQ
ncbi:MAG: BON domain-containing protein [Alphaproteobacteria bacterium]